jgi:hypothetical protein
MATTAPIAAVARAVKRSSGRRLPRNHVDVRGRLAAAIDELDIGDVETGREIIHSLLIELEPRRASPTSVRKRTKVAPLPPLDRRAAYPVLVACNRLLGIQEPKHPDELEERKAA